MEGSGEGGLKKLALNQHLVQEENEECSQIITETKILVKLLSNGRAR